MIGFEILVGYSVAFYIILFLNNLFSQINVKVTDYDNGIISNFDKE